MNEPGPVNPDQPQTGKFKFNWKLVAGFMSWFLVNGVLWSSIAGGSVTGYDEMGYNVLLFPANLLILIVLSQVKKTRLYALGVLTAIGLNSFISLILGLFWNTFCFIPFFTPVKYF